MKIKKSRLKSYCLKRARSAKDNEGNTSLEYDGSAFFFQGMVWPASGKLQAEVYGQRLNYIRNCKIEGDYTIIQDGAKVNYVFETGLVLSEGDGVYIYSAVDKKPDYRIVSIKPYTPLYVELEKI